MRNSVSQLKTIVEDFCKKEIEWISGKGKKQKQRPRLSELSSTVEFYIPRSNKTHISTRMMLPEI